MPRIYRPYDAKVAEEAAKQYSAALPNFLKELLAKEPLSKEDQDQIPAYRKGVLPFGFHVDSGRPGSGYFRKWGVYLSASGKDYPEPKAGFDLVRCARLVKEAFELSCAQQRRLDEETRIRRQERTIDEHLEEILGEELLQAYQVRTQITDLRPSEGTVNFKIAVEGIPEADLDFLVYTLRVALQRHLNAKRKAKEG